MADQISSSENREVSKEAIAIEASLHIEESIAIARAPVGPDGKPLRFEAGRPILSHEDEKAMKRLRLKLDLWILPILFIIMLLGSMDRSDIGNVQTAGMQKIIKASDHHWAQVVSLFYIGYVLTQFAASFQLKLSPPVVIGGGVIFWGIFTIALSTAKNWRSAVGFRILIGAGEGYIHAASLYLSLWYGPEELASRAAFYYSTATLAGAFNGLIAYGIVKGIGNAHGHYAYEWILIIEGAITVFVGVLCVVLLPGVPEKVKWGFSEKEKRLLVIRTWRANNTPESKYKWREFKDTFTDLPFWGYVVMFAASQIGVSCLSNFLPAIIHQLGYSTVKSQLMTVPIYACGFIGLNLTGIFADKLQKRGVVVLCLTVTSLIGYIMLIAIPHNVAARYVALCIVATCQFSNVSLIMVWLAFNTRKWTNRATAGAFLAMFAQSAVLAALQGFDTAPPYRKGNTITLCIVILAVPAAIFNIWYYNRLNQIKETRKNDPDSIANRGKPFEELGTAHPDFRYSI